MMKAVACKTLLAATALLAVPVLGQTSILIGDFEGGLDGWNPSDGCIITNDSIGVTLGSESMSVSTGSITNGGQKVATVMGLAEKWDLYHLLQEPGSKVSMDITASSTNFSEGWMLMGLFVNAQGFWGDFDTQSVSLGESNTYHTARYEFALPREVREAIGATGGWWGDLGLRHNHSGGTYHVDNIVVSVDAAPVVSPVNTVTTNSFTITAAVVDHEDDAANRENEVDRLELYLDGVLVHTTSNHAGGSVTNVIEYDAVGLEEKLYAVAVKGYDINGNTTSSHQWNYEWSINVVGLSTPPDTDPMAIWSINFANAATDTNDNQHAAGFYPVTNAVCAAPVIGTNGWFNYSPPNFWYNDYRPVVNEGSGGSLITNSIVFEKMGTGPDTYGPNIWDGGGQAWANANAGTIWATSLGGSNCNFNIQLRGLVMDVTYDLYLYFTHPHDGGLRSTTYTLTTGLAADMSLTLVSDQSAVSGGVQDANYVVITDIIPEIERIEVNVAGDDVAGGGLSALQLVARRPMASVIPTIQSFDAQSAEVTLTWDSEPYVEYNVMGKSDLQLDPSWTSVTNAVLSQGTNTTVTVPMSGSANYFSIESK